MDGSPPRRRDHDDAILARRADLLKLALVAEEAAGVRALRLALDAGHAVGLVLTDDRSAVAAAAREARLDVRPPALVRDAGFAAELADLGIDLLLNVHSLVIAKAAVLAAPRIGSFNLHPGPLPEYAGLNAPSWAIYEGAKRYGTTLHWMTGEIDAGPIAYAVSFEVAAAETGLSLTTKCVRHGLPLLEQLLRDAAGGERLPAREQDAGARRLYRRGPPHGGAMPWSEPASLGLRFVRACTFAPFPSPWGSPRARAAAGEFGILRARATGLPARAVPGAVVDAAGDGVLVATADELVAVDRVDVGGTATPAATVLRPGEVLTDLSRQNPGGRRSGTPEPGSHTEPGSGPRW